MHAGLLRVTGLHAFYGESHILHGVDFSVNRGEVVVLLGRNGAGRTTTLKAILGLVSSRSGSVMVNGREAIALARRLGSTRFWLSTGGHNDVAQALYESLGGERKTLGDVNYWWTLD